MALSGSLASAVSNGYDWENDDGQAEPVSDAGFPTEWHGTDEAEFNAAWSLVQ